MKKIAKKVAIVVARVMRRAAEILDANVDTTMSAFVGYSAAFLLLPSANSWDGAMPIQFPAMEARALYVLALISIILWAAKIKIKEIETPLAILVGFSTAALIWIWISVLLLFGVRYAAILNLWRAYGGVSLAVLDFLGLAYKRQ